MLFPLFLVPREKSGFRTTNGMSDAMTSNGKYITVEAASMLLVLRGVDSSQLLGHGMLLKTGSLLPITYKPELGSTSYEPCVC